MRKNPIHDFKNANIKHEIESIFYKKAGSVLSKMVTSTIVTGPDYQRHVDNMGKYIKNPKFRICEIDIDIFIDIYKGLKCNSKISVVNKSVELYGSGFIDCDLTCRTDLDVIKKTLLKQIDVMSGLSCLHKVFIMSISLRSSLGKEDSSVSLRPIAGLLGCNISKSTGEKTILTEDLHHWWHEIKFHKTNGRIKELICYKYNSGGGPMLTCYIDYL